MHTIKPFDHEGLIHASSSVELIITIEEHVVNGGLGSAVLESFSDHGITKNVVRFGIPDLFAKQYGSQNTLMSSFGLDSNNISKKITTDHKITDGESLIGGGTMPDKKLLTPIISIENQNIDNVLTILSNQDIPLIPRVSENKIIIDVRSCSAKDDKKIIELLNKL